MRSSCSNILGWLSVTMLNCWEKVAVKDMHDLHSAYQLLFRPNISALASGICKISRLGAYPAETQQHQCHSLKHRRHTWKALVAEVRASLSAFRDDSREESQITWDNFLLKVRDKLSHIGKALNEFDTEVGETHKLLDSAQTGRSWPSRYMLYLFGCIAVMICTAAVHLWPITSGRVCQCYAYFWLFMQERPLCSLGSTSWDTIQFSTDAQFIWLYMALIILPAAGERSAWMVTSLCFCTGANSHSL